jgi:hypothetical protein
VKEFITAANDAQEPEGSEDKGMEFAVDGVLCRCYKPNDGQLAVLMASTGRHSNYQEQIAGVINFFVATLDDESHNYLVSKLLDRNDKFGLEEVQNIMEWMVEEWGARPTKSSSGSTPSRQRGGRKSTQPTAALTS